VSGDNPGGAHGWRTVELARFPDLLVREREVRPQEYAITQHVVGGRMLVPAAAWLRMAYEVLAVTDGQWLGMTDVDFTRARWSDRDERLAVQLTKVALQPDDERFTLHARDGEGAWQEHVTGRLSPSLHQPVAGTRWTVPAAIVDRCPVRLDGGTLYQALAAASVGYGPGLRLVEEVWTGQGEAIGRLSGWDAGAAPLDAAMHVIAAVDGALPAAGDRPYVPYRLGRLRVRAATATGTVWSHATVRRAEPETPDEVSADVRVLDEAGNILAEFGELRLRQIRSEPATAVPAVDGTYHVRWRPAAPASPTVPARPLRGAVWISHRAAGHGPALLREAGVDVWEVPARVDAVVAAAGSVSGKSDRTAVICDLSVAGAPNPDQPMAAVLESVRQVLDVIRELPLRRGLSELVVLTGDAVSVRPSDTLARPDLAAVWGLLRCAAFELPDLRIARVDLETGSRTRDLATFCRALADGELRPELGLRDGHWYAPRLARTTVSRGRVRLDSGAYLITGGLGGLGLAVANRLAQRGAQRLVLVGRRGPTAEGRQQIERMRADGCDVIVEQADVTLPADVARACGQARRNGAVLRGVVHAAGVLRDRALLGMNPDDLQAVLAPKVEGAWHLHQATLDDPLDFFLLFSSAAAVLGSPGQGNYAAANAFLDAFAHRRRAGGRAATSVNWGPWAEIGMVAEPAANPDRSAQLVRALMPADGLDAVEAIIMSGVTDVTVLPYDVGSLVHLSPATADPEFFGEVVGSDFDVLRPGMSTAGSNRPDLARRFVPPDGPVERRIAEIWQRGLGIEGIGAEDSLYELGGDSVFAGQVLTRINQEYGIRINFAAAFATFTIRHLAEMVDAALIANVAAISDDEARRLLAQAESCQSPSEGVA
jgi:myxalamid-type polyketide synthase MxaE and MxaD